MYHPKQINNHLNPIRMFKVFPLQKKKVFPVLLISDTSLRSYRLDLRHRKVWPALCIHPIRDEINFHDRCYYSNQNIFFSQPTITSGFVKNTP